MDLIDRMDLLSRCGGLQGAEQQTGARDIVSLSAIATFSTVPLVEWAALFLTGYSCSSALIYHTEELNVDTSKYFYTQGSPGACVFPLFKMERANPSLVVCDGNGNRIVCVYWASMQACICVWVKITGRSSAFSPSKYQDCQHTVSQILLLGTAMKNPHKC